MAVKLSTHACKVLGGKAPEPPPPGRLAAPEPDGITRRLMDSKVLGGIVPLAWTPDGKTVWVDGIPYTAQEIGELMARRPDAATMKSIHNVKRTFDGTLN